MLAKGKPNMAAPPRKHRIGAEQRRALQLLASIPFGAAEATMLANGVTRRTITHLVRAGLATLERASINEQRKVTAAGRIRITAAGRSALED
jgi:hypothetical protein